MPALTFRKTLLTLASAASMALAGGCIDPYACRSSDDAQGISFDGDPYVTYNYEAPPHINLQLGDTTTATSAVYDANACGVKSGPKFNSINRADRFSWRSSAAGVVTVDARGKMLGVGRGQATILIEASGASSFTIVVDVVPRVANLVVSPSSATVHAGDLLRFDAYMADAAGQPIDVASAFPYPVNLTTTTNPQDVENYIPDNRLQLLKRFPRPGTYELHLVTVVRNVRRMNAAVVTVLP